MRRRALAGLHWKEMPASCLETAISEGAVLPAKRETCTPYTCACAHMRCHHWSARAMRELQTRVPQPGVLLSMAAGSSHTCILLEPVPSERALPCWQSAPHACSKPYITSGPSAILQVDTQRSLHSVWLLSRAQLTAEVSGSMSTVSCKIRPQVRVAGSRRRF